MGIPVRQRAHRAAIFAAVVAAHLLVLRWAPDFRPPPEVSDREPSLPITLFPLTQAERPRAALSRARPLSSPPELAGTSSKRAKPGPLAHKPPGERKEKTATRAAASTHSARPWIDWEKQADAAVTDRMERAAEAARRSSALSRWREHVMPAPWAPHGPQFRWDYAATHRFQSTPLGLVININDRCIIIITLGIFGGCAIGHIPVYGDLFAHMDDPKEPIDSTVP